MYYVVYCATDIDSYAYIVNSEEPDFNIKDIESYEGFYELEDINSAHDLIHSVLPDHFLLIENWDQFLQLKKGY